jgi:hypothetical protein
MAYYGAPLRIALLFLLGCLGLPHVQAQGLRDPTIPPAAAGLGEGGNSVRGTTDGDIKGPISVLVVDGRAHVVVGTRLYAQGQKLGAARIERITETEIWLREGRDLRKVSTFSGVQRRAVPPVAAEASKP